MSNLARLATKKNWMIQYRAEWVNSYIKQHCAKVFARREDDVHTFDEFQTLVQAELKVIARKLKDSKFLYANLAELRKAADLKL